MTPAQRLTNEIRNAVSRVGARLFVMVTGKFWAGQVAITIKRDGKYTLNLRARDIILRNPRLVNVGFEGLSDLVGFTPVTITHDMIGRTVAVAVAVEVKTTDRPTAKQLAFVDAVKRNGGRSGIARSVDDAIRIVSEDVHKVQIGSSPV